MLAPHTPAVNPAIADPVSLSVPIGQSSTPQAEDNILPYNSVFQYCKGSEFQVSPCRVIFILHINNTGDKTYSIHPDKWYVKINGVVHGYSEASDFKNSDKNSVVDVKNLDNNTVFDVKPGNEVSAAFSYNYDGKVAVGSPILLTYVGMNNTSNDVVSYTIQSLADQSTTIGRIATTGIPIKENDSSPTSSTDSSPTLPAETILINKDPLSSQKPEETNVKTPADKEPDIHSSPTPAPNLGIFKYCTYTFETGNSAGFARAPPGESYVIVTMHIKNTSDATFSTNPWYWKLDVDGVIYEHDSETYDSSIHHLTAEVAPGGDTTARFVYLIQGIYPSDKQYNLEYLGPGTDA